MFTPSALASPASGLEKRYYYTCYNGDNNCSWYIWGRFVVLGAVILVALAIFILCACMTARRRRARGAQPYYGTGWMAGQHGAVNYYGNNNTTQQPAPAYNTNPGYGYNNQSGFGGAPPQYGYGYNNTNNTDYYNRGQETGVELQSPPATYGYQQPGNNTYQPPAGPPPGKTDVIR